MSAPEVNGKKCRLNISRTEVDRDPRLSPLERADVRTFFFAHNLRDTVLLKLVIRKKHETASRK